MTTLTQSEAAGWQSARSEMIAAERASVTETLTREEADAPSPEDDRAREKDAARKRTERAKAKEAKAAPPPDDEPPEETDDDGLGEGKAEPPEGEEQPEPKDKPETKDESPAEKKARQLEAAVKDARAKQRAAEARIAEKEAQFAERLKWFERQMDAAAERAPEQAAEQRKPTDPFADRPKIDAELLAKIRQGIADPIEKIAVQEKLLLQFAERDAWREAQEAAQLARRQEEAQRQRSRVEERGQRERLVEQVRQRVFASAPPEQHEDVVDAYRTMLQREMQSVVRQNRGRLQAWIQRGATKEEVDAWIADEANYALHEDAAEVIRAGQNAADYLLSQAKDIGWRSKAEREAAEAAAKKPAAPEPPEEEEPERQIERLRENRRAASAGASGGGAPKSSIISIEDVAGVEDEAERHKLFMKYHAQRKAASRKNPRAVG